MGATPDHVETPRCLSSAAELDAARSSGAAVPTGADPKWRFFWRVGPRPAPDKTRYAELNAPPVVPAAFPEWAETMDGWGFKMLAAIEAVAEAAARGFGLPPDAFTSRMRLGECAF